MRPPAEDCDALTNALTGIHLLLNHSLTITLPG